MIFLSSYGNKEKSSSKSDFSFVNGNKKVELKIINGKDYLNLNKSAEIRIEPSNYEGSKFMVFGKGIEKLGSTETDMDLKITPTETTMSNGFMEIKTTILEGEERL